METSWKVKDAKWMAARKAAWSAVNSDLSRIETFSRTDVEVLKKYFLDGKIDKKYEFKSPTPASPLPFLFQIWLHPKVTQKVFDDALAQADRASLQYTANCLEWLSIVPPLTLDDSMPRFFELFYLHPERQLSAQDAMLRREEKIDVPRPFDEPEQLFVFWIRWIKCDAPPKNSIVRFVMGNLAQLSEKQCMGQIAKHVRYKMLEPFLPNLKQIIESPKDPRHESVQELFSMIETGKFPKKFGAWLNENGVKH